MSETAALRLTERTIEWLAAELERKAAAPAERRLIVGVAGIPGAGKSTLAARLLASMSTGVVLVPMDGFHLSNARLHELGLSERKGSPETFDAEGYISMLARFRDPAETGPFPIYDRTVHEPMVVGDAGHTVTRQTRVILTEGNYLLLDEPPWHSLGGVLNEAWWLDTPPAVARQWLLQRHMAGGRTQDEAERRYVNDARNVRRVMEAMRPPDRVVCWGTDGGGLMRSG